MKDMRLKQLVYLIILFIIFQLISILYAILV
jgi:hypothetical protein